MFNIIKKEIEWAGKPLTLETGKMALQADSAVFVTYGRTQILATLVVEKQIKEGIDFLPLGVHYREMAFAAGKIPGGFHKREGKASEREILASRLIDRSLRPVFPELFFNAVQIVVNVLSYDPESDPIITSMIGCSAALAISGIPVYTNVAAVRVGLQENGSFIANPSVSGHDDASLDLIVAGSKDSIFMVESGSSELSEGQILESIKYGHEEVKKVLDVINDFASSAGKENIIAPSSPIDHFTQEIYHFSGEDLHAAYDTLGKQERNEKLNAIQEKAINHFLSEALDQNQIISSLKKISQKILRERTIKGSRIDGRDNKTIRPITSEVGILHNTHGSALFTRGETQALVVVTLGTTQDEQIVDDLTGDRRKHYMLDYIFPSYSVGEASPPRAPSRREVGHGNLAMRGLKAVLPSKEAFPYTKRVTSEITSSNGSTSMATVCGASLALMDAGVPLTRPVAGIAMGLIKEKDTVVILSDILGDEDFLGDMDFKVVGTEVGVTALQMDIKIKGITVEILKEALLQAKDGRIHILSKMAEAIVEHRPSLNQYAPTINSITIDKDKIREVIGSGGKTIREICEKSGTKIDIDDSGKVTIAAMSSEASDKALAMIRDIIFEPQVGQIYEGQVIKILSFGAVVKFMGREGMVHISELSNEKVESVESVLQEGAIVTVKVIGVEGKGKIRLSIKALNQENNSSNEHNEENKENMPRKKKISSRRPLADKTNKDLEMDGEKRPAKAQKGLVSEGRKYYN
jgi:polyribonucleotide nucleotidyltransferase